MTQIDRFNRVIYILQVIIETPCNFKTLCQMTDIPKASVTRYLRDARTVYGVQFIKTVPKRHYVITNFGYLNEKQVKGV